MKKDNSQGTRNYNLDQDTQTDLCIKARRISNVRSSISSIRLDLFNLEHNLKDMLSNCGNMDEVNTWIAEDIQVVEEALVKLEGWADSSTDDILDALVEPTFEAVIR